MKVDPQYVKAISKWPNPTNIIDISNFLSLAGYYPRFVKEFSQITSFLTNVLRKVIKFVCIEQLQKEF